MAIRNRIQSLSTLALTALLAFSIAEPPTPAFAETGNERDDDWNGGRFDFDEDGVQNKRDNCWKYENPDQSDIDGDRVGDICDPDRDNDKVLNEEDNCPDRANRKQKDQDEDGLGNVCDADIDGDDIENPVLPIHVVPPGKKPKRRGHMRGFNRFVTQGDDNCPFDANPEQSDGDGDGKGDVCDNFTDSDGDGVADAGDNCPDDGNPGQEDGDSDGVGDACEPPIVINEVAEIAIDAATPQELIDAMLLSNAGQRVEADESITKFGSVAINLTAANYLFSDSADPNDNQLMAALPYIESTVVINGNGATLEREPNASFRFLHIRDVGDAVLNDITFLGGGGSAGQFEGGAIRTRAGTLIHVNRCSFLDNQTSGDQAMGGAIANRGNMVIRDGFFSGNSVFSDKFESSGGAVWGETGDLVVINSTFTGNAANGTADEVNGGALSIKAFGAGGNLIPDDGNFVQNTILADNTGGNCHGVNVFATSKGHNVSDDATCASWAVATGDVNGVGETIVEDLVGTTFLPVDAGPAVDIVPAADCVDYEGNALDADQRGEPRPNGAACDSGAVER